MICINESGLYTLILRSNKPEAKKFKKWVTSEVLPSIRKTGTYSISQNNDIVPMLTNFMEHQNKQMDLLIELVKDLKESKPTQTPVPTDNINDAIKIVNNLKPKIGKIVVDNDLLERWKISFDQYTILHIISSSKEWAKKELIDNKEYYHIQKSTFFELLAFKKGIRTLRRDIKKLEEKNLIKKEIINNDAYYMLTEEGNSINIIREL
jgi:hypothetical protein